MTRKQAEFCKWQFRVIKVDSLCPECGNMSREWFVHPPSNMALCASCMESVECENCDNPATIIIPGKNPQTGEADFLWLCDPCVIEMCRKWNELEEWWERQQNEIRNMVN